MPPRSSVDDSPQVQCQPATPARRYTRVTILRRFAVRGRDLLSIAELSADEMELILRTALSLKRDGGGHDLLRGKTLALIFEKPSLRTRVSFDVAMQELGGHAIYLNQAEVGLGQREPVGGRRARAQPLRRRHRRAHLRARDAARPRALRGRAGDQRALGRRASLPGAGGPADGAESASTRCVASGSPSSAMASTWRSRWRRRGAGRRATFAMASPTGYSLPEPVRSG